MEILMKFCYKPSFLLMEVSSYYFKTLQIIYSTQDKVSLAKHNL